MALDLGLAHFCELCRLPTRLVVLVDDHGAHALIKIVAMDDARHYAEFGAHARLEIPSLAAPHLRQRQLETERGFALYGRGGLGSPFRVRISKCRFTFKRHENVFDPLARKQPVDRAAPGHDRPLAYQLIESGEDGVDRNRAAQAVEYRGKSRRRNAMGGDAGGAS